MTIISFSFTAVARLGVPPGKWFCLARTGLGFEQYSCCVCHMHHENFEKHWRQLKCMHPLNEEGWRSRLDSALDATLRELGYYEKTMSEVETMKSRLKDLIYKPDNYIVNSEFKKVIDSDQLARVRILTDGPECIVKSVFPTIPPAHIITGKSRLSISELDKISQVHVGTNESDIRIPQTRFLISSKPLKTSSIQTHYRRLTPEVISAILESR